METEVEVAVDVATLKTVLGDCVTLDDCYYKSLWNDKDLETHVDCVVEVTTTVLVVVVALTRLVVVTSTTGLVVLVMTFWVWQVAKASLDLTEQRKDVRDHQTMGAGQKLGTY